MRDLFPYEKRADYPHMNIRDKEIWNRFLDTHPEEYKSVQYDFHVGEAPPFNTLMDDEEDKNQDMLYRLRIDVIGTTEEYIDIIEVKPDAGPSTIGQIQSYTVLYKRDEEPTKPIRQVIVTNKEKPNMNFLCKEAGVKLVVV